MYRFSLLFILCSFFIFSCQKDNTSPASTASGKDYIHGEYNGGNETNPNPNPNSEPPVAPSVLMTAYYYANFSDGTQQNQYFQGLSYVGFTNALQNGDKIEITISTSSPITTGYYSPSNASLFMICGLQSKGNMGFMNLVNDNYAQTINGQLTISELQNDYIKGTFEFIGYEYHEAQNGSTNYS